LYTNNVGLNNWINIKCIGTKSNTSAIGVKVRVKATIFGKHLWQMREISGQTGFGGQNSLNAEFGLGDATIIDFLKIEWPSGLVQVWENVVVNQFLTVTEDSNLVHVESSELATIPIKFNLSQNYPNPFNPVTTIKYQIPKFSEVNLEIYNIAGQLVKTLVNKNQPMGYYLINWNGKDSNGQNVASGIYFFRLIANDFIKIKKMVLVR